MDVKGYDIEAVNGRDPLFAKGMRFKCHVDDTAFASPTIKGLRALVRRVTRNRARPWDTPGEPWRSTADRHWERTQGATGK